MIFRRKKKQKKELSRKSRYFRYIGRGLLIYALYVLTGALLPFAGTKQVSGTQKTELLQSLSSTSRESCERAAILETNTDALLWRLAAIQDARERIMISTFDIRPGKSWNDISSALYDAADRGVRVQILVDGAFGMIHMGAGEEFYALGTHENIEIKYYNPPNPLKPWTFNGRLHDKYIITDDKYLIAGGRNFFDYFLGDYTSSSAGYDRDVFIFNELHGTSASNTSMLHDVTAYFDEMWSSSFCKTRFSSTPFYKNIKNARVSIQTHDWAETLTAPDENTIREQTVSVDQISFVANPTHIYNKEPYVWEAMIALMEKAEDRVLIQTPYAVFSKPMYADLSELVDTVPQAEMVINSIASGDNIMASSDYLKNKQKIVDTGVSLYEYQGAHSIHAKSAVIDNDISIIGSFNLDMRSVYIDTEMMIIIEGEEFTSQLTDYIEVQKKGSLLLREDGSYDENDLVEAKEVAPKKRFIIRLISIFSGLFRNLL